MRILYTTTGLNGRITPASGLVVVSATAPAGPRPAVLWEHGTTGVAQKCAPSVLKEPFTAGAMFVQGQVLNQDGCSWPPTTSGSVRPRRTRI